MTHKANHQSRTQFIDNWKVTSIPRGGRACLHKEKNSSFSKKGEVV